MSNCPCGSGKHYSECCEKIHQNHELALTPEQLMRARYSAFAVKNTSFLMQTWDPQVRFEVEQKSVEDWANQAQFTQLEIINSSQEKNKGFVEFKAHFIIDGESQIHHEKSQFRKSDGLWYYRLGK